MERVANGYHDQHWIDDFGDLQHHGWRGECISVRIRQHLRGEPSCGSKLPDPGTLRAYGNRRDGGSRHYYRQRDELSADDRFERNGRDRSD